MPENPICWVRSNWSKKDLEGKSVQFDFPFTKDRWIKGAGTFRVNENESGELVIWIVGMHPPADESNSLCLTQSLANAIHRCVPTSTFDYNLFIGSVPSPWNSVARRKSLSDLAREALSSVDRSAVPSARRSRVGNRASTGRKGR